MSVTHCNYQDSLAAKVSCWALCKFRYAPVMGEPPATASDHTRGFVSILFTTHTRGHDKQSSTGAIISNVASL